MAEKKVTEKELNEALAKAKEEILVVIAGKVGEGVEKALAESLSKLNEKVVIIAKGTAQSAMTDALVEVDDRIEKLVKLAMEEHLATVAETMGILEIGEIGEEAIIALTPDEERFLDRACKAYGIDQKYLLDATIDRDTMEAVLSTHGGARVRYTKGMEVEPLSEIKITGINRAAKRRTVTGAKAK